MRVARSGLGIVLVLAMFGVFLSWRATAQTTSNHTAKFPATDVPADSVWLGYGATRSQDPEMTKLAIAESNAAREVDKLVKDYARNENEAERGKIKTKLGEALSKQFDAQQKRRDL
jgi:hypothetical protein